MKPSRELVLAKVNAMFAAADREQILLALDEYAAENAASVARVQLGILKLSAGKPDRVQELVQLAKEDYRDILARAEYPNQLARGPAGRGQISQTEHKRLERADRAQYLAWLRS